MNCDNGRRKKRKKEGKKKRGEKRDYHSSRAKARSHYLISAMVRVRYKSFRGVTLGCALVKEEKEREEEKRGKKKRGEKKRYHSSRAKSRSQYVFSAMVRVRYKKFVWMGTTRTIFD